MAKLSLAEQDDLSDLLTKTFSEIFEYGNDPRTAQEHLLNTFFRLSGKEMEVFIQLLTLLAYAPTLSVSFKEDQVNLAFMAYEPLPISDLTKSTINGRKMVLKHFLPRYPDLFSDIPIDDMVLDGHLYAQNKHLRDLLTLLKERISLDSIELSGRTVIKPIATAYLPSYVKRATGAHWLPVYTTDDTLTVRNVNYQYVSSHQALDTILDNDCLLLEKRYTRTVNFIKKTDIELLGKASDRLYTVCRDDLLEQVLSEIAPDSVEDPALVTMSFKQFCQFRQLDGILPPKTEAEQLKLQTQFSQVQQKNDKIMLNYSHFELDYSKSNAPIDLIADQMADDLLLTHD